MLKHRNYTLLYFCLAPITVHLLLSSLKIYPFGDRFILYTLPLIILIYANGIYRLYEYTNKKNINIAHFLLILPVVIMFYSIHQSFPIENEEIKKSLNYIERNIKKDEAIYVYYGADKAFQFYKEMEILNINNTIIVGTQHMNENRKYDEEILNLTGKIWLLFSHVYPIGRNDDNEETYMVKLLLRKGSELLDVKKYKGSAVYYFDTTKPGSK